MRKISPLFCIILAALVFAVASCAYALPSGTEEAAAIAEAPPVILPEITPVPIAATEPTPAPITTCDDEDSRFDYYYTCFAKEPYEPSPTPKPTPTPRPTPAPTPRPAHLDNIGALSNASAGWHFVRQPDGPPRGRESAAALRPFDAFFIGDTTEPRIFLTFDSGYERGYTHRILDTLQEFNVHAAFFLTESYIRRNPAIVQRKIDEGHVIANHSVTHRNFPDLTDEQIEHELVATADRLYELTGHVMSPFFRPPAGVYSRRVLALVQSHGYYTVFWSFAHRDWVVADQPPVETTINRVVGSLHNGMVILLHTNSRSNTYALPYILEQALELGFEFVSLYELW